MYQAIKDCYSAMAAVQCILLNPGIGNGALENFAFLGDRTSERMDLTTNFDVHLVEVAVLGFEPAHPQCKLPKESAAKVALKRPKL